MKLNQKFSKISTSKINIFLCYFHKNTYELQIRYKILQNFSVNELKKTFDVQILLNSFKASQKRNANNKREIMRQLNQLPIQNQ